MAIEKEYWTGMLLEKPIPDGSFLNQSKDMSEFSDGKTINYAEAGVEPEVFINNNVYPIGMVKREDIPKDISLDTFDTKNTHHTNIEKIEESPNKSESITRGHKNALHKKCAALAAFNWTPQKHSADTPVLKTTGVEVVENGVTRRRMIFADVLSMETKFRGLELTGGELNVCLSSEHLQDLQLEDINRYNQVLRGGMVGIFKIFNSSLTPTFSAVTSEKEAFGAAKSVSSMAVSFFWEKDEVMRCQGEIKVFITEDDPQYRGDILGYQKRFLAMPLRNFGIGAIYSAKV